MNDTMSRTLYRELLDALTDQQIVRLFALDPMRVIWGDLDHPHQIHVTRKKEPS